MLKRLVAALVALAALVPAAPAGASVPVLTISGKGWGHGVGLSQAGAHWMGVDGATVEQILGHFYPGTSLGTASGPVRVVVRGAVGDGAGVPRRRRGAQPAVRAAGPGIPGAAGSGWPGSHPPRRRRLPRRDAGRGDRTTGAHPAHRADDLDHPAVIDDNDPVPPASSAVHHDDQSAQPDLDVAHVLTPDD